MALEFKGVKIGLFLMGKQTGMGCPGNGLRPHSPWRLPTRTCKPGGNLVTQLEEANLYPP